MTKLEEKIENLIQERINNLGYELYDVEYVKEGKDYYLRVFIDSEKGIDLNDCERVNDSISDLLDEADYIKEAYFLEVSSPGIERVLRRDKHLEDNIGKMTSLNLFKPIDKKRNIEGILENFNEEEIIISIDNIKFNIDRKNISLIKTIYNWD